MEDCDDSEMYQGFIDSVRYGADTPPDAQDEDDDEYMSESSDDQSDTLYHDGSDMESDEEANERMYSPTERYGLVPLVRFVQEDPYNFFHEFDQHVSDLQEIANDDRNFVTPIPMDVLKSTIDLYPDQLRMCRDCDSPLHVVCKYWNRPGDEVQLFSLEHVQYLVEALPESLSSPSREFGDLPFHILCGQILNRIVNEDHDINWSPIAEWGGGEKLLRLREIIALFIEKYPGGMFHNNREGKLPVHIILDPASKLVYPKWFAELHEMMLDAMCKYQRRFGDTSSTMLHIALKFIRKYPSVIHKLVKKYPDQARTSDSNGLFPLHIALQSTWEASGFFPELLINPQSAAQPFANGRLPLHAAIEMGREYCVAIRRIVRAYPPAIQKRDPITGLYPFQQGAVLGVNHLDTVFELLRDSPDLVMRHLQVI